MKNLSKSKLIAYKQCPKRLWLQIYKPELRQDSLSTIARFSSGTEVGSIAQMVYDPTQSAVIIDIEEIGFSAAFAKTKKALEEREIIFEAGFSAAGALAFADVMLPDTPAQKEKQGWRMVEVKSSTRVKDYHRDDVAIQAYVAKQAGVQLHSIALAHIDSSWVYPGGGDYAGLLVEADLSEEAFSREEEVAEWIVGAQQTLRNVEEPAISTGVHCDSPFECGFYGYCSSQEPQAEFPVQWLPGRRSQALMDCITERVEIDGVADMRDIPDDVLNTRQRLVKTVTLSGEAHFDEKGAALALEDYPLPAYFIDFETIQFAIPIWADTRPYQQLPFQFSVHLLDVNGSLNSMPFLDLSGKDPSQEFAKALIAACAGEPDAPIFVYNAGFENRIMRDLAKRFPQCADALEAMIERVVDLLPIARTHYYHPSQHGSWSIKAVLPATCPELSYSDLDGVQDGGMAQTAYLEAIADSANPERVEEIRQQLLDYCALDTYAMVRLWAFFTQTQLQIHHA